VPRHLHPLGAPASCGPDGAPRWGKPWWARRTSCRAGGLRCPLWRCQRGGCVVPFGGAAAWQLGAGKAASGSGGIGAGVVTRAPCLRWLRAAHAARPGARRAGWAPCPCGAASDSASSASCGAAGGRGAQGERLILGPRGAQVTAPQLALLEGVMARMERVDVWILMNGGGGGVNPFQARAEPCRVRAWPVRGRAARAQASQPRPISACAAAPVCVDTGRCRQYPAR